MGELINNMTKYFLGQVNLHTHSDEKYFKKRWSARKKVWCVVHGVVVAGAISTTLIFRTVVFCL